MAREDHPPTDSEVLASIPVREEDVRVGKRRIDTARVRVRKTVDSQIRTVTETLNGESVQIERVPKEERLARKPEVRQDGETWVIPVVEERIEITKTYFLKEEIRISKRPETRQEAIEVELRREHVRVERETIDGSGH